MEWPKDRRKAFLSAAEAFGTLYEKRMKMQRELTRCGICWSLKKLTNSDMPYTWANNFREGTGMDDSQWWPNRGENGWTPSCDKERSLFCYLMAALSDKEFEELNESDSD